jgi:hypothetical protein
MQILIDYILTHRASSLSLYDVLENYSSLHDLTFDIDPTQQPRPGHEEHDNLLITLLHLASN